MFVIPKSRYDSIDSYLSPCSEPFNDIDLVYDKDVYKQLRDAGRLSMAHETVVAIGSV